MRKLFRDIDSLGGLASMAQLLLRDHWREEIEIAVTYGSLIRVRKGWYALPSEPEVVLRAWRVGGRVACVSAVAHHQGETHTGALHVEVAGNTARLRSPTDRRRPLTDRDNVVVHWARKPSPGDVRAVNLDAARRQAQQCARAAELHT